MGERGTQEGSLKRAETLTPMRLGFLPPGSFEMIIIRTKIPLVVLFVKSLFLPGAQVGEEHSGPHPAQGPFTSRCPIFWAGRRAQRAWAWLGGWPVCSCKRKGPQSPPLDPTSHLADGKVEALGGQGQSKVTLQVARGSRAQARGNFHKPTGA